MSQKEVVVNAFKFRGRSDQIQSSEEKKPVQVFFFPSLHCVELLFCSVFVCSDFCNICVVFMRAESEDGK